MGIEHAKSGEVVDIVPPDADLTTIKTRAIFKSPTLEVIAIAVHAGKEIPTHQAKGEITVQCLRGHMTFTVDGKPNEMRPGQLLHLDAGVPHSVAGIEDSIFLLTLNLSPQK